MNNNDDLALTAAAEKYRVTYAAHRANPRDYEALAAWDKAAFEFSQIVNNNELDIIAGLLAERDADKKLIAELEARAVSVKLPPCVDDLHGVGMVMSADAVVEALAAAGIKLEVGE